MYPSTDCNAASIHSIHSINWINSINTISRINSASLETIRSRRGGKSVHYSYIYDPGTAVGGAELETAKIRKGFHESRFESTHRERFPLLSLLQTPPMS